MNPVFALTLSQQDIYFDQLHHGDSPIYNIGGYMSMEMVDPQRLEQAQGRLVDRNDAFGIRIVTGSEGVAQSICAERTRGLPLIDFSAEAQPETAARAWMAHLFATPIAFENSELYRSYLLRLGRAQYWYVAIAHHLMVDGLGFANWTAELCRHYADLSLEPAAQHLSWQAVAQSDQDYIASTRFASSRSYWAAHCAALPDPLLALHYPPASAQQGARSERVTLTLAPQHFRAVKAAARASDTGVAQLFLGLLSVYFGRVHGRDQLVFGIPAHNRSGAQEKSMVGVFTNIAPLCVPLEAGQSFAALCAGIARQQRQNFRHQRYPSGYLKRDLGLSASGKALYEVGFNYLGMDSTLEVEGAPAQLHYVSNRHQSLPLMVTVWESGDGAPVELQLDFNLSYLAPLEAERLGARLLHMLDAVVADMDVGIDAIGILAPGEAGALLAPADPVAPASALCIHELFEQQVERTPEAVAVVHGHQQLSYRELNARANQVARRLRALGAGSGSVVGLMVQRSATMVAGLLGILKCGAAYVPLDPGYPVERLAYMLEDSGTTCVLTEPGLADLLAGREVQAILLDEAANWDGQELANLRREDTGVSPEQLAYLIYTSGSTGRPKGVEIAHRSTAVLLEWARQTYSAAELRSVLASTSLNFDLSVFEVFVPLCYGHQCVVVRDALALLDGPLDVSLVNTVPSAIKALLAQQAVPASALVINLAGEPLSGKVVNAVLASTNARKVYNLYGPSEDTTYSTWALFEAPLDGVPSIGQALPQTQLYVLSDSGQLLPHGAVGELYIGGAKLARGYRNRPELTAERFVAAPFDGAAGTLYRTGDLVRFLPDGQLAFLGRKDEQVKLRGFRIELGEIEVQLARQQGVKEALVLVHEREGEQQLVAYLTGPASADADWKAQVQAGLRRSLPEYMVPSLLMVLEQFPLTPNGKVDKRALPPPQALGEVAPTAPATDTEHQLAAIWQQLLKLDSVSIDANFFELGGHSLTATRLATAVARRWQIDVSVRAVFEHPTVRSMARHVAGLAPRTGAGAAPLVPVARDQALPLSYAQERLWVIDQFDGASHQYNMPAAFRLTGPLDQAALRHSLEAMVARHEVLRTVYVRTGAAAAQLIAPLPCAVPIEAVDLRHCAPDEQAQALAAVLAAQASRPFDLGQDLMLRAALVTLGEQDHVLCLAFHHIAADGWSIGVFSTEFMALYGAAASGASVQLPVLPIQYADFAFWQRQLDDRARLAPSLAYWRERLHDVPAVNSLPLDSMRPSQQSFRGSAYHRELAPALLAQLTALARAHGATLFMALQGAFAVLLSRWSGEHDIVVGTPIAGRSHQEVENLIGFFANTVVLRTEVASKHSFVELLAQVRQRTLEAHAHQDVPFELLVETLRPERSLSHSPLFQIMFSMQNNDIAPLALPGLQVTPLPNAQTSVKFDLELNATEQGDSLALEWRYAQDLFAPATIERMAASFELLLEGIVATPDLAVGVLPLLGAAERARLALRNAVESGLPAPLCIHELFEQQVERTPEAVAVVHGHQQLSYRELNARANQVARRLRALGAGSGSVVGLMVQRSATMVAGLLGILKCGAAYVPLDPGYPVERLAYMLEDSGTTCVLTEPGLADLLAGREVQAILLDEAANWDGQELANLRREDTGVSPEQLAYLIYTSGSTGRPKGVEIAHRSTAVLLEWARQTYSAAELRSVLASTSLNFDLSVFEVFVPLCYGHQCVVVRDALALLDGPLDVSLVNTVPSAIKALLAQQAVPASALVINLAGEPLSGKVVNAVLASTNARKVYNLYGPSEDTTYSTWALFEAPLDGVPSIGQALPQTQLYVLSDSGQLLPHGAVGELYIGGAKLARGYRNRPELTAERFVAAPFDGAAGTLYRTGDLVRFLPDGQLAFLGRKDEQVKLRGFRIELGEIEVQLARQQGVKEALVLVHQCAGEQQLVAYLTGPASADADWKAQVQAGLRRSLPEYMVPSLLMVLEQFPLTPNGKVDKRALPPPQALGGVAHAAAATDTERQLAAIWQQVLKLDSVSIDANFFELGGHSLTLVHIIHAAASRHGLHFSPKEMFQGPTIRQLAHTIGARTAQSAYAIVPGSAVAPVALSYSQYRIWFLQHLREDSNEFNVAGGVLIEGGCDAQRVRHSLDLAMQRHPALSTRIVMVDGQPRQTVDASARAPLHYHDLSELDAGERERQAEALVAEHDTGVIDLAAAPLCSFLLIKMRPDTLRLHAKFHHIIADGWSVALFFNQFVADYQGAAAPQHAAAERVEYCDYVHWQAGFMASAEGQAQQAFWTDYLQQAPHMLALPFQHPPRAAVQLAPRTLRMHIPAAVRHALIGVARKCGGSLFHAMHTSLLVLLARLTRSNDVILGVPVSGRHLPGLDEVFGVFINNLPVRSRIDLARRFDEVLAAQVDNMAAVLSNQDVPFERILELVGAVRDPHSTPLFQILFNMLSLPSMDDACARLGATVLPGVGMESKFNMTFYVSEAADGVDVRIAFNPALFDSIDIELLLAQYSAVLSQVAANSATACSDFELGLSGSAPCVFVNQNGQETRHALQAPALPDLRAPLAPACSETIPDCLRKVARAHPQRSAIQFGDVCWSYGAFDAATDHYAQMLHDQGIRRGDIVGVITERTDTLVVATLAILKAGAAFMMLSASVPPARIAMQLQQCPPRCLIVLDDSWQAPQEVAAELVRSACPTLVIPKDLAARSAQWSCTPAPLALSPAVDDIAYVSFTSGTEGSPKVIAGTNGPLSLFHVWAGPQLGIGPDDRFGMFSGLVHDPLQRDMFTPLAVGATLCIPPESVLHQGDINSWVMRHQLTVLNMTPSLGKQLVSMCTAPMPSVRLSFFVGEPLTAVLVDKFVALVPQSRLINFYGSTESCRSIAFFEVPRLAPSSLERTHAFPAGVGIAGVQIVVLGQGNRLCGVGELGQIGVRSRSLTRGYMNDAALTAAKYIANPFGDDASDRIYLTGDMGRYRADGAVECLGRMDQQIKIRGFRVEIAEIETALHSHPGVAQAAIVARRDSAGDTVVHAYIVAHQAGSDTRAFASALREHMKRIVPVHMIPSQFVLLDRIPLTENGKLDAKALPIVAPEARLAGGTPPANALERELLALWENLLGGGGIGVTEQFFELGGHSLLMTRLLVELKARYGVSISYASFFERSAIRDIAAQIASEQVIGDVLAQPTAKQKISI